MNAPSLIQDHHLFPFPKNDRSPALSLNCFSLQENGHLISITPVPQQVHCTTPSGEAPMKGFVGSNSSPHWLMVKEL